MLSYEPELVQLRPILGDGAAGVLIARERRQVFSIYPELRLASWGGVMLLATAAGIVLKNNLDRIGPLALAMLIGLAAAACYAWTWWRRTRASLVDDYVLLLGALLVSADVAFIETQFHVLGGSWHRHFLLLAIEMALRAYLCAALLLVWRAIDLRLRPLTKFSSLFEHFAATIALSAGVVLMFESGTRTLGCLITIALAAGVIAWGMRTRRESFVLYAFLYGVIAVDVLVVNALGVDVLQLFFVVVSTIAAIVGLIVIHARMKVVR